jgi:hypothetical protein
MFDTALTSKDTVYATNAVQFISISSVGGDESYTIDYDDWTVNTARLGEQQSVTVSSSVSKFVLRFMGVSTAELKYGLPVKSIQDALNDLPVLYPNLTTVTETFDPSGMCLDLTCDLFLIKILDWIILKAFI